MISLHRLMPLDNQKIMSTLYAHVNTYYQNVSNKLFSLPVDFVYPVFFSFVLVRICIYEYTTANRFILQYTCSCEMGAQQIG